MRLVLFTPSREDTAVQQLPEPDMVVDPRPIFEEYWDYGYKFKVTVNGTTLTITRTDPPEHRDSDDDVTIRWEEIRFRVYSSNEDRYSFESTKYIYHGLHHEKAPLDTTEVIIKDGVESIGGDAFGGCRSLVKVTIPDSVKTIEHRAFQFCTSLRFIQLSPNLQYIGEGAFSDCSSLEAVFLPPTVTQIGSGAFIFCTSLRILNIPNRVGRIGRHVIDDCYCLLSDEMVFATNEEQIEWLQNRCNPFHKLCCHPSVTPQAITQYIQDNNNNEERARTNDKPKFTALHLLAANPSVTGDMITAYLQLAPDVVVMQDNIGMTPLHMLCSRPYFSNSTRDAISSYLSFSDGKEAAFMIDKEGKSPLDYLYENDSIGLLAPSVGGSFSDIMVWWYACLDMNLLVE